MVPYYKIFGRLGNNLFQGAYLYAQAQKGLIPDIYVQDPAYFDEYRDEIRHLYGQGIGSVNKVAIHVRRGDYVNNRFYVDLTQTDYYERAMAQFPDSEFLVFSDDIEWCKGQEIFKDCSFSEGNDEVTDLNLMASCKGIIMANSSFSFWGAYLSNTKKIIAPSVKNWYSDQVERTVCPQEWTRI